MAQSKLKLADVNASTGTGSFVFATTPTLVTPVLGAATGTSLVLSSKIDEAKGADIASAGTTDIGAATGNYVNVTGTTTITAFGTVQAGTRRTLQFNGILTLTHNATSLILPTSANITTAAGDTAQFISLGSGNWKCVGYQRASGAPLASGAASGIGWSLKEYQASTGTTSITSGTLDLSTDKHYRIVIQSGGDNTNVGFGMRVNAISTSTYEVLGYRIYTIGAGANSGNINDVNSARASWVLDSGLQSYTSHQATVEMSLRKTDGTNFRPMITFQASGVGSQGNRSDDMYTFNGSGTQTGETNVTSVTFLTNTAGTRDWEMWIYKSTTS